MYMELINATNLNIINNMCHNMSGTHKMIEKAHCVSLIFEGSDESADLSI